MATKPSLKAQILDREEATWQAMQSTGAAMLPFITADCIMQFPMGLKLTADSQPSVQEILHSPAFVPWKSYRLSNVDVTPVGPEGAVISYKARANRPVLSETRGTKGSTRGGEGSERDTDKEVDTIMLCSSVWRLEGGKWMMCFHQQTLAE